MKNTVKLGGEAELCWVEYRSNQCRSSVVKRIEEWRLLVIFESMKNQKMRTRKMGERERERERVSELIFGELNGMDLGFRGIYDLHHQCIQKI